MVNLVDVMLVFICGLLISIIMYWNINIGDLVVILDQSQLMQIENPEELTEQMQAVDSYGDVGSVMDPKTGNVYIMDDKGMPSGTEEGETATPDEGKAEK